MHSKSKNRAIMTIKFSPLRMQFEHLSRTKCYCSKEHEKISRRDKEAKKYEASEKTSRPTRNRYYCNAIGRTKMLFRTEVEANRFIAYNSENFEDQERTPRRAYKCCCCDGWHVTHYIHAPKERMRRESWIVANRMALMAIGS